MRIFVIAFLLVMMSTCILAGQKTRSEVPVGIGEPRVPEGNPFAAKRRDYLVGEAAIVDSVEFYEGATAVMDTHRQNPKIRYPEIGRF